MDALVTRRFSKSRSHGRLGEVLTHAPRREATSGAGGYVSVEVPPDLAYDAPATAALARRLHDQAGVSNLLVKIPGPRRG
jgi:transaldolase